MAGPLKLDRIDINILAELQNNGRLSNVLLAEAVNLSPSPCLNRVRRLEKAGYIERYKAVISLARLGDFVTVFTEVTLKDHRHQDFVRFEREIATVESVQSCHLISGGYDYLIRFVARSISAYQQTIEDILARDIGVIKYFSYVVIKSVVDKDAIPLSLVLPPTDS